MTNFLVYRPSKGNLFWTGFCLVFIVVEFATAMHSRPPLAYLRLGLSVLYMWLFWGWVNRLFQKRFEKVKGLGMLMRLRNGEDYIIHNTIPSDMSIAARLPQNMPEHVMEEFVKAADRAIETAKLVLEQEEQWEAVRWDVAKIDPKKPVAKGKDLADVIQKLEELETA